MRVPGFAVFSVSLLFGIAPSLGWSCISRAPTVLEDVTLSDLVVVGSITDYEIVLDNKARERRQRVLDSLPEDVDPEHRERLESQTSFLSDYARFNLQVQDVLKGNAPSEITVVWDNSTFGEPKSLAGTYLVALVEPGSRVPPLRGPSATILPHPDGTSWSVLQAPCASAFLFRTDSSNAKEIVSILQESAK